jgi:hypothetical protein
MKVKVHVLCPLFLFQIRVAREEYVLIVEQ